MAWTPLQRIPGGPVYPNAILGSLGIEQDDEAWRNDAYEIFVRYIEQPAEMIGPKIPAGRDGFCQLSIKRLDREPARDFRHLQQIKNEIMGPEREAIEIFPRESRLVDGSNQTHLWVFAAGVEVPIGFPVGGVTSHEQANALNRARTRGQHKGKQRPWERGLTTGRNEHNVTFTDEEYSTVLSSLTGGKA